MDIRPKSNKQKRLEAEQRRERKAERRMQNQARGTSAIDAQVRAERALKDSRAFRKAPERLMDWAAKGQDGKNPQGCDVRAVVSIFRRLDPRNGHRFPLEPDVPALQRLVLVCSGRTRLLRGQGAERYANALLALSAHVGMWVRAPEDWLPRSHNSYRQFHALVRHLTARYEVPTFMNTAWLEGLTSEGVIHQRWFLHVAQGQNLRTAKDLPIGLTKRQAHLYTQAPNDFDVVSALRWALVHDLGGDERLVRSILGTRAGTDFAHEEFWATVVRWLVNHPMLDPVHHGPIVDYLYDQRFVASVVDPDEHLAGAPRLVPPQPNLTMKGRSPETLLRVVAAWHRRLGRSSSGTTTSWTPCAIPPLRHVEGEGASRRTFTTVQLVTADELNEEGRAMAHCVGSYAASCASGRVSIWSLRVEDAWGRQTRLLTVEVAHATRQIIQARQRFNAIAGPKELLLLRRWADAGGPSLSHWLAQ
jgi:hypothetical protein